MLLLEITELMIVLACLKLVLGDGEGLLWTRLAQQARLAPLSLQTYQYLQHPRGLAAP